MFFEGFCFGILAGVVFCLIAIGVCAKAAEGAKKEDDDVKIYTLKRRRGQDMSNEELVMILFSLRMSLSGTERQAIDQIIDKLDNERSDELAQLAKKLNVQIGG